ncbi:ComEC/Rec2 family competence protein [Flavobacterium sp. TBRC 19031]|uniref:ComEC/Rec2 family competence protein n=1 Tax=Flavobacterium mekongense TaxID=3379707 RepID=UPI00399AD10F
MKILQFPLNRICAFFVLGLLLYQKGLQPNALAIATTLLIGLGLLVFFHGFPKRFRAINGFGWAVCLSAITIGLSTAALHQDTNNAKHYLKQTEDQAAYIFKLNIKEKLKNTTKNERYIAVLEQINNRKSKGKIILNLKHPIENKVLPIGSHLIVSGHLYKNKQPFNPNQFDYCKYLENQQIYAQIYGSWSTLKILENDRSLWSKFSNFRTAIIDNLRRSDFNSKELAVMTALLLGQQQDIDPETLKDYQLAGAVHILSVSGLHVGFIMIFIGFILKPIPNTRSNGYLKLLLIILALWSYGILAGLSPSVVRSVTMFSFVAIGQHWRRNVNIYHSLLVSIMLILLWKPSFLFDVGFQLSYLALFFILWLQPLLTDFWHPKNKIIGYFWDILTVSFAAQLGTLPLSIYYFHQFPGLFFITNIIVLPVLSIVMVVGLLAVIVACFGAVPQFIIIPLEMMINWQNKCIEWVANMDAFVFKNIGFTTEMLWIAYILISCFVLWLYKPIYLRTVAAMISVVILQVVAIHNKFKTENAQELIVYHLKKTSMISERKNNNVTVYGNDSIQNNIANNPTLQSYLTANFAKLTQRQNLKNLYYFKSKKILLIDSNAIAPPKIHPDIVVMINSPKLNLERYLSTCKPKQIVADGSNYKSYIRLWRTTCHKAKIPFHYTNEKGFYKI